MFTSPRILFLSGFVALSLVAAACSSDAGEGAGGAPACFADPGTKAVSTDGATADGSLILLTHGSFAISEGTLEAFTAQTGIDVEVVLGADGGALVNQAVLSAGNPIGDVLYGIDNTFLCAALEADVFVPYESPLLDTVPEDLIVDPHNRVTPIDYGDVCANYWVDSYAEGAAPATLDDLADPDYADQFVTQNPETSTPGLAFLLATIAHYGEEGWEQYWQRLFDNGISITDGWEEAYNGEFVAGGGDRPIVMSYASSPAAEVVFADPPTEVAPTAAITDTCYRQIEFAGILAGTERPAEAALLIDFLLSPRFQEDIPLNMFVFPANAEAELPQVFTDNAALVDDAVALDPAVVGDNRNAWTDRWTDLWRG